MKKTIHLVMLAAGLLLSACEDFLEKTDPTRLNSENFYRNGVEMEQAVNGVYSQLQTIIKDQWVFNELPSDNTTVDYNPSDRGQADRIEAFEYYTVNAGNVNNTTLYNRHYNAIFNANNALLKLKNSAIADADKMPFEGQLKFLRAYLYFQLVQYYGDVILITEPFKEMENAYTYRRVSQSVVYDQIEQDLVEAAAVLPAGHDSKQAGRATKGAALALLGKVYLTQKKHAEATRTLREVLTLGYFLLPDYADVFNPQNKNHAESVFEVQFNGESTLGEWSSFAYTFAPRLSKGAVTGFEQSNPAGWNIPTNDIISAYEPGDRRKAVAVGLDYVRPATGQVIPYIKKFVHLHAVPGRTNDNWPVLRYADVLLMLAESINEQSGPNGEAYEHLNAVRTRTGLPPLGGLDQASFREKVLGERRVELAFENWRWFDLKRTKTSNELVNLLSAHAAAEKANPTVSREGIPFSATDYNFNPYEALFPIPSNEIRINDIGQNIGY